MTSQIPHEKYKNLLKNLSKYRKLAIAFSGGIDSTLLAYAAKQEKIKVILITVTSPLFSHHDEQLAKQIAQQMHLPHILIHQTIEKNVIDNTTRRCYHCKHEEATSWINEAQQRGYPTIADGANYDDLQDPHRPGIQACSKLGIHHPLADAKITKTDIRIIARQQGITTWNQPANACLASRIQYGEKITTEKLKQIEQAEDLLRNYSPMIRVRLHHHVTRIEVPIEYLHTIITNRTTILPQLKAIGLTYITLDLEGYRSGSMHEGHQK
jgi:uncharacterized protein